MGQIMITLGKEVQRRVVVLYDVVTLVPSYAVVSGICEKLLSMLHKSRYQLSCFCVHSYRLH